MIWTTSFHHIYITAITKSYFCLILLFNLFQGEFMIFMVTSFKALLTKLSSRFGYVVAAHVLCVDTVSYTHLTLPTICSVQISVVAVSLKKKKKKKDIINGKQIQRQSNNTQFE
eukprot:TRINITY_DN2474_c0_g1_i1.p3 TRINITY_DN2474_c0_g1~~TRINITY_DN2474_c0_g1_i1.p3  ORF type:complete len:114 (-),score=17.21 TRINITY_DN2474_c0_g1_i1:58-399(-)